MKRCLLIAGCVVALAGFVRAQEIDRPTGESIVAPDAKLEPLFTRRAPLNKGLTEGPAVAPDGSIYFSDIPFGSDKGLIMRYDPKRERTTVFSQDSGKSNGLIFDAQGYLLACEGSDGGGRCVSRWNIKTRQKTVLADKYQGKRFNAPNDLCLDRQGRIYFTDPRYLGTETRELQHRAVYRINTDGSVIEITHDISKPNGIALSPDGKTLYVADHDNGTDRIDPDKPAPEHGPMKVYAFPLGTDGAVNGERRILFDWGKEAGCDGMTVDAEGNVYFASRTLKRPGVLVVNPEGKEVAFIPTGPKDQKEDPKNATTGIPSNVEFGKGEEISTLYITIDKSLYRIQLKAKGFHRQYQ